MSHWYYHPVALPSSGMAEQARAHQNQLTKPQGSLGYLEEVVIQLAGLQQRAMPQLNQIAIAIFAADHGVVAKGISAYPQIVTAEMIKNFSRGGAAITVLARQLSAKFQVINLGTIAELDIMPNVTDCRIAAGTANFCETAAMSAEQLQQALSVGCDIVMAYKNLDVFVGGEMGIGNTTSAAALACALLDLSPAELVGAGTGLDAAGIAHKVEVVQRALDLHGEKLTQPLTILQALGGFEIAALCGSYIACAQQGIPMIIDGFISSVAALFACKINPAARAWMLFGHQGAEKGHQRVLAALNARPILQLDMRLGEGSGAALAISVLQQACLLHRDMATFDAAGVTDKNP
jgi:nicotinate-nucleotide--dimethylbenzimidazole phosphoribosyltransferase